MWKFPSATAINRDWPFGDCTVAKGDEKITLPAAGPVNVTNPAKKTRRPAEVWPLYGMTRRWVYAAAAAEVENLKNFLALGARFSRDPRNDHEKIMCVPTWDKKRQRMGVGELRKWTYV